MDAVIVRTDIGLRPRELRATLDALMGADGHRQFLYVFPMPMDHRANDVREIVDAYALARLYVKVPAGREHERYRIIEAETLRPTIMDCGADAVITLRSGTVVGAQFFRYHASALLGLTFIAGVASYPYWSRIAAMPIAERRNDVVHFGRESFELDGLSMGVDDYCAMLDYVSARRLENSFEALCLAWCIERGLDVAYPELPRAAYMANPAPTMPAPTPGPSQWRVAGQGLTDDSSVAVPAAPQ